MTRRAFTLIESLAVVALLAIAMSTLAVGVAPSVEAAKLRDARSAVLDTDARARVLARGGSVIRLTLGDDAVWAHAAGDPQATPLVHRSLPAGTAVSIRATASDQPRSGVRIGADGRSEDYVLAITAGGRVSETLVAGLTGYAFERRVTEIGGRP